MQVCMCTGFGVCFFAGTVASLLAAIITVKIRDDVAGLRCGSFVCVKGPTEATNDVIGDE